MRSQCSPPVRVFLPPKKRRLWGQMIHEPIVKADHQENPWRWYLELFHKGKGQTSLWRSTQAYHCFLLSCREMSWDKLSNHSRSEEHTSELQSLMRISYAVFCLKKKNITTYTIRRQTLHNNHIQY